MGKTKHQMMREISEKNALEVRVVVDKAKTNFEVNCKLCHFRKFASLRFECNHPKNRNTGGIWYCVYVNCPYAR